jgi:hypothetical protein
MASGRMNWSRIGSRDRKAAAAFLAWREGQRAKDK